MTYNIHLGGIGGHGGLQMASMISEVKFDHIFKGSNLKYPDIHLHIASDGHLGSLWGHCGLQITSEVKADLKMELSNLSYPC